MSDYYFIGIGGIGMSGLARFLCANGHAVAGYDRTETALTSILLAEGMDVCAGQSAEVALDHFNAWVQSAEHGDAVIVRTPAISPGFPVLIAAQATGIPIVKRSELLGSLTRNTPTLAVAGTHGKTTTSAILTHLLLAEPGGCRGFLGGILTEQQSNVVWSGNAEWTVVEADEFDRSFLHLHPTHAVITSADPDHLDIYGDAESFLEGLRDFAKGVKGALWMEAHVAIPGLNGKRYGCVEEPAAAVQLDAAAIRPSVRDGWVVADVVLQGTCHPNVRFPLPGNHNVLNALAALALAMEAGADPDRCLTRLAQFKGIERRFTYHVRTPHGVFIDDYAHHPAELEAAIQAARLHHPQREITGIFQPHLFSRTRDHLAAFGRVLAQLDRVFLLPIYPAREAPIPGIDSQTLFENIPNPRKHLIESHQIFDNLKDHPPEVLMTLGAGDIDKCVKPLADWLQEDPKRFKPSS